MRPEVHATQVDLSGLMTVLGAHLYSTPTVAVRELVQNAHDSIVRRRIEDDAFGPAAGRIDVVADPRAGTLAVRDNGAGMTREEIGMFLSTVGVGYTRMLREGSQNDDLIGLFGLGFLSAFVISERTTVRTTSYQQPGSALEYRSATGEQYTISDAASSEVGTEVELQLSADHRDLADPAVLRGVVTHYCRLLEIPVHVGGDPEPINAEVPPWRPDPDAEGVAEHPVQRRRRRLDFASRMDPAFGPLCTIDVEPSGASDAQGLLWVQDSATYGSNDNRRLAVYLRGMLLDDDARDLLPRWAGFVSGTIESRSLVPTASREDLQRDGAYAAVAEALQVALIAGLSEVAREQPEAWARVLRRHNEALLGAALVEPELEALLSEDLEVPTSGGDMTVRELVAAADGRAHVGLGEGGFEEMRFRALKVPIANGRRYAVLPFLRRWCTARGVDLIELGTTRGDRALFRREPLDDAEAAWLAAQLAEEGQELIPAAFEPADMPFVLVPDREAELKQRIEADEAQERIASAALRLARLHTQEIDGTYQARLFVNLGCPAMRALLDAHRRGAPTEAAVGLLRSVLALMAAGERDTRASVDLGAALTGITAAVEQLVAGDV